jgi:hypothetical protein
MPSSIDRILVRSITAKMKIERCIRHVTTVDVGATRTNASGRRSFSATSSLFNKSVPLIPRLHMTSSVQKRSQAVRFESSMVGDATNLLKSSYEFIVVDATTHPGVGVITLHRPKALNALCDGLFADLIHAATSLDQNYDDVGCLVLTGSTKAFAAGADISEMKDRTFDYAYTKVCTTGRQSDSINLLSQYFTVVLCRLFIFYRLFCSLEYVP